MTAIPTVTSLVTGAALPNVGDPIEARNPADLREVVARVELTDADGFEAACRAARAAQPAWAAVPATCGSFERSRESVRMDAAVGRLMTSDSAARSAVLAAGEKPEIGRAHV